ncbi:MAG: Rieske (2Fe-2S) protein [Pseudomonadota bacterium]
MAYPDSADLSNLVNSAGTQERAYALPGYLYYDPAVYAREQSQIFNRSWQYVCHVSRIVNPGDYCVRDIGDQSIVVVRGNDGTVSAFHNVCQHRAHRLVEGAGNTGSAITCPYHNWSYELGGALRHAPKSEHVVDFNKSAICLSGVRVEDLCGFIFVNLDPG